MEIKWNEVLIQSETSAEFFKHVKTMLKKSSAASYAKLAEQWGFTSRSLISEILNGNRIPSYRSYTQIVRGLKLTANERELLKLLIVRDNPKFLGKPLKNINDLIEKNRIKLSSRKSVPLSSTLAPSEVTAALPYLHLWPRVYSAVGKASSLAEIIQLVGTTEDQTKKTLNALCSLGLIDYQHPHYQSNEHHVSLDSTLHRQMIEAFVTTELKRTIPRFDEIYKDSEQLVFGGSLMVKKNKLEALKKKLKTTLNQFIEEHYDSDGDSLISLIQLMTK